MKKKITVTEINDLYDDEDVNEHEILEEITQVYESPNNNQVQVELKKEQIPQFDDFVMIENKNDSIIEKNSSTNIKSTIFKKTNDLFSNLSSKIAQNVSDSSNKVSQNMKEQISTEKINNIPNNDNVSQKFCQVHKNANTYVDSICKEEKNKNKKDSDYNHICETLKNISDKTTQFVKNLSKIVDSNIRDFCDYTFETLKDK